MLQVTQWFSVLFPIDWLHLPSRSFRLHFYWENWLITLQALTKAREWGSLRQRLSASIAPPRHHRRHLWRDSRTTVRKRPLHSGHSCLRTNASFLFRISRYSWRSSSSTCWSVRSKLIFRAAMNQPMRRSSVHATWIEFAETEALILGNESLEWLFELACWWIWSDFISLISLQLVYKGISLGYQSWFPSSNRKLSSLQGLDLWRLDRIVRCSLTSQGGVGRLSEVVLFLWIRFLIKFCFTWYQGCQ